MDRLDLRYICTQIGNLSGVPVRIYRDGESVFFHTTTGLPVDPALLYREQAHPADPQQRAGAAGPGVPG